MSAIFSILDPLQHDFQSQPPHPLIYASLVPTSSPSCNYRLDMHKPRKEYTIGRSPSQDLVLPGVMGMGQVDWLHCSLIWDGTQEIRITDHGSVNGTWVNSRRLAPGESHVLHDGDSVRLGVCKIDIRRHCDPERPAYYSGYDHSFVFRQFTQQAPPCLSETHKIARQRLDELDRARADIETERLRLQLEEEKVEAERDKILSALPPVPLSKPEDFLERSQRHYTLATASGRLESPELFPSDICDFKPWLLPKRYVMERKFYCPYANTVPPPLSWGSPGETWFRIVHHDIDEKNIHVHDWNDPELSWGSAQGVGHFIHLDQSSFLHIPPSIIYWSADHDLPVYMHPKFHEMSSGGPYAHPYARSEFGFSDYSAAEHRAELGLPPLKDARPIRPSACLGDYIMPDERLLAARVEKALKTNPRALDIQLSQDSIKAISIAKALKDNVNSKLEEEHATPLPVASEGRSPLSRKRTADDLEVASTVDPGPLGSSDVQATGEDVREGSPVADADQNSDSGSQRSQKRRKMSASPPLASGVRLKSAASPPRALSPGDPSGEPVGVNVGTPPDDSPQA